MDGVVDDGMVNSMMEFPHFDPFMFLNYSGVRRLPRFIRQLSAGMVL